MLMVITTKGQRGAGLMEVLISMLVLSIGVFGFIALQARATAATSEALKRSDAILILQGLGERMRLNPQGKYTNNTATSKDCSTNNCSPDEQALADISAVQTQAQASNKNMNIGVIQCSNTSTNQARVCLIAAWDKTNPTIAAAPTDGTASTDCLKSDTGRYQDDATCLLLEAY